MARVYQRRLASIERWLYLIGGAVGLLAGLARRYPGATSSGAV